MSNTMSPSSMDNKNRIQVAEMVADKPRVERSGFPLDMVHTTTMNEGAIVPLDCFPVMPKDSLDLENDVLVSVVNPFVDRMFSGMRLYVHYYYCKCEWLWKGWKNFATKGRRGNVNLALPWLSNAYRLLKLDGSDCGPAVCDNVQSLPQYLGSPTNKYWDNATISSSNEIPELGIVSNSQINRDYIMADANHDGNPTVFPFVGQSTVATAKLSALPFAMYQSIYRYFYLNKNLTKDNPWWFPDDDEEFILPYAGGNCFCLNEKRPHYMAATPVPNNFTKISSSDTSFSGTGFADAPALAMLRYRQYDGDPNTAAMPFLERGGITDMFLTVLGAVKAIGSPNIPYADGELVKGIQHATTSGSGTTVTAAAVQGASTPGTFDTHISNYGGNSLTNGLGVFVNQNKMSELAVYSLWSRRNATCDGDYNSLIKAHYGIDPNSEDRKPIYIGGSVQRLTFSEILQTSESSNTPLGTQASRAYSAGHARIGHFEVPDFGYVMAVASLVPDTYYTQGLPEYLDPDITGAELPFPEFNSLPPQPRLNKRIYAFGTVANNLWGYNEPFLDWKVRSNKVSGMFLVPPSLNSKFASMTFARYLDSTPALNNNFVTLAPWNIRNDMFSVPSQPHFIVQFGSKVSAVRPMPYFSKQATLAYIS